VSRSDTRPKSPVGLVWRDSSKVADLVLGPELGRDFPAPGALMIATWAGA